MTKCKNCGKVVTEDNERRYRRCQDCEKIRAPRMVKFYAGTGKPIVGKIDLLDKDGKVLHTFQSRNEYKKARKFAKAHAKKVRKGMSV